jgi:hypothetical protein
VSDEAGSNQTTMVKSALLLIRSPLKTPRAVVNRLHPLFISPD